MRDYFHMLIPPFLPNPHAQTTTTANPATCPTRKPLIVAGSARKPSVIRRISP